MIKIAKKKIAFRMQDSTHPSKGSSQGRAIDKVRTR